MKLDLFKRIDILAVLFVFAAGMKPAFSQVPYDLPLWAQSTAGKLVGSPEEQAITAAKAAKFKNDAAFCDAEAKKPQTVKHPGQVIPYQAAFDRCMFMK